jgi:hypothetical protein
MLATGSVLVWMDAHMSFGPTWFDKMMDHVDSGTLLCSAWWDYVLSRPLCWGADFVWCGERNYAANRVPGLTFRHRTHFSGDGAVEVPMWMGGCYMALRETYEKLGGFSPFFRTWGRSEEDMCARAQIMGIGVKCVTGAHVGHLTRPRSPYPVRWEDIEFNQVVLIRTVFQQPTAQALERLLQPLPADVRAWLARAQFFDWHRLIQSRRQITDGEFFRRFVSNAPECVT